LTPPWGFRGSVARILEIRFTETPPSSATCGGGRHVGSRRETFKPIMVPEGSAAPAPKPRRDDTLIKALVRAHRWRRQIESGQARSITDLAEQEGVTDAYVCRLLPLTCLAPDIVESIVDGRQSKRLRLAEMLGNGPLGWQEQRANWGFAQRRRKM
jgi:hypothetical protein